MLQLGDLYEAITDAAAWQALPSMVAQFCGGRSSSIQRVSADTGAHEFDCSYFDKGFVKDLLARFIPHDLWLNALLGMKGEIITQSFDEIVSTEELMGSIIYNELVRAHDDDTAHCLGTMFRGQNETLAIAIHRPLRGKPFDAHDAERMLEVARHVRRVARARELLGGAQRKLHAAHEVIAAMGRAALTVDAELRVLSTSTAASALLRRGDGLGLTQRRLALGDPRAATTLQRAVREIAGRTASGRPAALLCRRPSCARPYRLRVLPNGSRASDGVLVLINDPEAERPGRAEAVGRAYGLSPAETELLGSLLAGRSLAEAADARAVEVSTLRTQLRSVFAKTETTRQADLIALMADFPA